MMIHNTERFENTYTFPETCGIVPGDVSNCLHTVVMITQTVIKNTIRDNGWMEGKRKKKKREGMRMTLKHT